MPQQTDQRTPPGSSSGSGDDLLQHAKQTTTEVVDQVQQKAGSRIDRQKHEVAGELDELAGAVRQLGQKLSQPEQGPIAQYAADYGRKAADGIERLTDYLRQKDTRALITEIENLGRRQPAILIGGAFLLGLAGARFLKSSMPMNEPSNTNLGRGLPPPPPHQPAHVQTTSASL